MNNSFKHSGAGEAAVNDRRAGFTMIELLVVIAIIAILAAVMFPAVSAARIRTQQGQVISNLKSLQSAAGIHKLDEHRYPDSLGPVMGQMPEGGGACQDVNVPNLYPEWIRDRGTFHSPNNEVEDPNQLYPVDLAASISRGYILSLPRGDAAPKDAIFATCARMHGWDNMSGHVEGGKYLVHYSRYRTTNGNDCDYKRQLAQRNPPENTVITWNDSYVVREEGSGTPVRGDYIILFLDGTARKYSVMRVKNQLQAKREAGCPDVDPTKEQIWRVEP